MRVLITGNMGYVGPILVRHLSDIHPNVELVGFDTGFFSHCLTNGGVRFPESRLVAQHFGDVRDFPDELLNGVDAVVHLAAISNDPMGGKFEAVTVRINYESSLALAQKAKAKGVKNFVFASSCSIYGASKNAPRMEDDQLNPLTAYSKSKVAAENALAPLADNNFTVTCLRFATACGMSDRIRLDLVLNDFVACAIANKEIAVISDGSPWRPLIDVKDMSRAIEWATTRDADVGGHFLAINVGRSDQNYQVADLARAVAEQIPGTKISINTQAPPDKRSYRVNFELYEQLAPQHQPCVELKQSIQEIYDGLQALMFADSNFRNSQFMRLKVLESHIAQSALNHELRWQTP
jgi:nucleoside-diphosphate-sugar epimerase